MQLGYVWLWLHIQSELFKLQQAAWPRKAEKARAVPKQAAKAFEAAKRAEVLCKKDDASN